MERGWFGCTNHKNFDKPNDKVVCQVVALKTRKCQTTNVAVKKILALTTDNYSGMSMPD